MKERVVFLLSVIFILTSCQRNISQREGFTKNIIVVIMDGARYSETWGDTAHSNIPEIAGKMSGEGVIYSRFYNNGPTYTLSGHTSITTGYYQEINNSGEELPDFPSFFQEYARAFNSDSTLSWIITSKDKLEVLANCKSPVFINKYNPMKDCGISGLGSGYRHDSLTLKKVFSVLENYHPRLVLINFREPDNSGHSGIFSEYLKGIRMTDEYIFRIWSFIQNDKIYKNSTAFFVTNDHGRHLDGINGGFSSHGDTCRGCRQVFLYAYGPDFKKGVVVDRQAEIIDIPATISYILKFPMPQGEGSILTELFK
jgi:predicted AlkP superfamily pyrophosphatase or phosphodiesterase